MIEAYYFMYQLQFDEEECTDTGDVGIGNHHCLSKIFDNNHCMINEL